MKNKISKCRICESELKVKIEHYGHSVHIKGTYQHSDSKDGVLFELDGKFYWFCNRCWKKIMDYSKNKFPKNQHLY